MTDHPTLRPGQLVRVTQVTEGTVDQSPRGLFVRYADDIGLDYLTNLQDATIEILAQPRPDEPQGLGAVARDGSGRVWASVKDDTRTPWYCPETGDWRGWDDLTDPVVLSEGWSGE